RLASARRSVGIYACQIPASFLSRSCSAGTILEHSRNIIISPTGPCAEYGRKRRAVGRPPVARLVSSEIRGLSVSVVWCIAARSGPLVISPNE
ncbi:hypothetical protein BV25DRAFT_1895977, partial [Artomyces pyxidatus]